MSRSDSGHSEVFMPRPLLPMMAALAIGSSLILACDQPTVTDPTMNPIAARPGSPASSLAAKSASHFTIMEELTDILESPCTGELVPFTARRFEETNVVEESDILHFQVTESISGSGTAEVTGTGYIIHDVSHFSFQTPSVSATQQNVFDMPHTIKFITKGGSENFLEHDVIHVTVLPDGEIKTTVEFEKAECLA